MVALKAANQRVKMSMGPERFRAAQTALAAEVGGAQSGTPLVSAPPATQTAAAEGPQTIGALSAAEQGTIAFLQRAGVKFYGYTGAQPGREQPADGEAEALAFLERAGALPTAKQPESAREQRWHR